jgi:alpha-D-ribose 1-methylphosphonate 5-triphosphate synthase subunit PhnI
MIGIDNDHTQNEGTPKMLALTLIECITLKELNNEEQSYLERVVERLQCSREMKDALGMMIDPNIKFTEMEEHLFKLVQDEESLSSHSNTPNLKAQGLLKDNSRHYKFQTSEERHKTVQSSKELEPVSPDYEDPPPCLYALCVSPS